MVLKLYQVIGRQFILDDSFAPIATFSWTYSGNGQGDSVDMVDKWAQIIRIDGLVINDWRMRPWTQKPIVIRSFTLSKISGGSHRNMMVGNNYVADAMVNVGSSETSMWSGVPQATGIPFPGTEDDPGDAYFDLHGFCAAGGTSWRVDIAYSPQPLGEVIPPPPPPPPPPAPATAIGNKVVTSGTSLSITTTAEVPAGSVILLATHANLAANVPTVSDGVNAYALVASAGSFVGLWRSTILTAPLPAGSTLTLNYGASIGNEAWGSAAFIGGLATAVPDKTASGLTGSVTTAALSQASEIAFGVSAAYNQGNNPGVLSEASGFATIQAQTNYGADHFSAVFSAKLVSDGSPVTYATTPANGATIRMTVAGTFRLP
jgi:hypothetical protein